MKVKTLVNNLLGIDPEMEVYIYLPTEEDDFEISDVEVKEQDEGRDDYVRLSFRA